MVNLLNCFNIGVDFKLKISLGFSFLGFPKLDVDLEMSTSLTKEHPSPFKTYKQEGKFL